MSTPIVIGRAEVAELLDWTAVLEATREGVLLAGKTPAVLAVSTQVMYRTGSLHLKSAALDDKKILSVKSNLRPTHGGASGILLAYDLETEQLSGVIDAGLMTAWRTGAIAALAAQRFVGHRRATIAVLGVGPVGRHCAMGLLELLDVDQIRFWSHHGARSHAAAEEFSERTRTSAARSVADAVSGADVIVTATPSSEPILTDQSFEPDAVILAMGADTVGKRELGPEITSDSLVVADVPGDALRVGESAYLTVEQGRQVTSLSSWLTTDVNPARDQKPLVFDSVGSSHVDAAVTALIMSRATASGTRRPLPW